ncbi:alpha/beta hydrolase [Seongchinamella unica]|uniref:Alpha/beta hydrolase n=1 Tax=Seongchinamella unica TaxID=2547392 RepID=A0A4V2ZWY0_9GAMM|nr:alpha/beta hydrolase [Seongchinamella unica]TDG12158.1 alpha/beta hydrolase [Seongchinamella unica]
MASGVSIDAMQARAEAHSTLQGGCRLSWLHWPALKPGARHLLLLHGGYGSWNHWLANIQGLRSGYEVWAVDLPGLGDSGDLPEPHDVPHIARLIFSGWLKLIGEQQAFDVAGFSFGAMVAGELAILADPYCRRCILVGAVGFGKLQVQVELLPPPGPERDEADAEAVHRENLQRLMLYNPDSIDALAVQLHARNLARFRLRSRSMARSDQLLENLPRIRARLIGIWGEHDATAGGLAGIEERRGMFTAGQSDSRFYVLPGVGHWAMYEAPRRINSLILGEEG